MLPQAPQFFTLPETENRETVGAGAGLRGAESAKVGARSAPISGSSSPTITPSVYSIQRRALHHQVGGRAGEFAGASFTGDSPARSAGVVRQLYAQGFDPAFTSTAEVRHKPWESPSPPSRPRRSRAAD